MVQTHKLKDILFLIKTTSKKKAKAKNSTGAVTALERQVYCTWTQ